MYIQPVNFLPPQCTLVNRGGFKVAAAQYPWWSNTYKLLQLNNTCIICISGYQVYLRTWPGVIEFICTWPGKSWCVVIVDVVCCFGTCLFVALKLVCKLYCILKLLIIICISQACQLVTIAIFSLATCYLIDYNSSYECMRDVSAFWAILSFLLICKHFK